MITEEQKKDYQNLLRKRKVIARRAESNTKLGIPHMFLIRIIRLIQSIVAFMLFVLITIDILSNNKAVLEQCIMIGVSSFVVYILNAVLLMIHETGHLIFGLLTGYRFLSLRVSSIILYQENGKLHIKKLKKKRKGGACKMKPPERNKNGGYPFILFILGGVINNLIFISFIVILIALCDNYLLKYILLLILIFSFLFTIYNVLPVISNDGKKLRMMLKYQEVQDSFYFFNMKDSEMRNGKKITELSYDIPENINKIDNMLITTNMEYFKYYQQLAMHNFVLADKILAILEEKSEMYSPNILHKIEMERLFMMVLKHSPIEEIASIYEHNKFNLPANKYDVDEQRVRYIYEIFMDEEEKKDIRTLIDNKPPKKWKECDKNQLYTNLIKSIDNYYIKGLAETYKEVIHYIKNNERNVFFPER